MTYDYFLLTFGRNSFDNNGAKIRSFVHYGSNYSNAFWNGSVMTYGDGNGTSFRPLTSIDICGHEIAHAVTSYSANLIYSYESGALNESFSDIFGNAIEFFADSSQFNWRIGEDATVSGNGIRNMANPKTHGDPNTYKGTFWHSSSSDNGGVHTNSGVQNYWFYLLVRGDTGTNDNGDFFSVDSLGMLKAEQVAYRNLTVYLTSSSQYADARYYAIQSAADLYGDCSHEVEVVTNAWYAVGVGPAYDSNVFSTDFYVDTLFCYASEPIQFYSRSVNTGTYLWYFGDGRRAATFR
jgi:Zn-dependent metalloprotease